MRLNCLVVGIVRHRMMAAAARPRVLRAAMVTASVILALGRPAGAQMPTGGVMGAVTDPSGGAVSKLDIALVNLQTGAVRAVTTTAEGVYSVALLPPGEYRISAQPRGFDPISRAVTVVTGTVTTADLRLAVGRVAESVTVRPADSLLAPGRYQIDGVVTHEQLERLPLNGRTALELAKLEPGVTPPSRGTNNRVFIAPLGSGLQTTPRIGDTRTTVDGASVNLVGAIGAALQVSMDAVQEFQIATVNFEPAASLTTNGTINMVTRSGTNAFHAAGFAFYRNDRLSAYPGLTIDPNNPDPFFERWQAGGSGGGPLRKDRVFFFGSVEHTDQQGVYAVQPAEPELAPFGGIFPSPAAGSQGTGRADVRLGPRNAAFVRYTADNNWTFAPLNDNTDLLPSAWTHGSNRVHQTIVSLTSVLSGRMVNDVRVSSFAQDSPEHPARAEDCPAGCVGLGQPRVIVQTGQNSLAFGQARTVAFDGHRAELTDTLAWQLAAHRVQVGADWEHSTVTAWTLTSDPAQLTLWSPAGTRQNSTIVPLAAYTTVAEVLTLPLKTSSIGVGSPVVPQRDFGPSRVLDLVRVYAGDAWRLGPRLTTSAGLAWSYEPNALNTDLTRPALLTAILGADGLHPPRAQATLSPTAGITWVTGAAGRTIVRGGVGRYFDPAGSANSVNLAAERSLLSPVGTGRLIVSQSNVHDPVTDAPLDFPLPTLFTGGDLMARLDAIRAQLTTTLDPNNRVFSVRTLDRTKQGTDLFDPHYATPSVVHVAFGIQHEFGHGFVSSADVVWKRFSNTYIDGIDYNRFTSVAGPVIPACTQSNRSTDAAVCSNGRMLFDTTSGLARYRGLLVRVQKRLSPRGQFLLSYALGSYTGTNGTAAGSGFNNDNWLENHGPLPTDFRHVLNASGFVTLPWGLAAALNVSAHGAPPFSAFVSGMDFNGDGTTSDLLPGTTVGQFRGAHGAADLARRVDSYNRDIVGRTFGKLVARTLTLPQVNSVGDSVCTADLRVSKRLRPGRAAWHVELIGEVFNLLNTSNLVGFSGDLNSAGFGQPTGLVSQVFGSGGPRAAQLGIKIGF